MIRAAVTEYIAHGWKVCRINPGSKGPRDPEWNAPDHHIRGPEGFPVGYGVGLLHAYSGTMALDIDNYPVARTWLAARGVDLDELMLADDAVQIRSGKPDSAKLLYACAARPGVACAEYPSTDKAGKPRKAMALDFRCATANGNSQQDALPPTIHPGRGTPYEWVLGCFGAWQQLPPLPAALEAIWDELKAPATTAPHQVALGGAAAPTEIERWLRGQDPGMCRADWVKVGMKLHAEYQGSQDGFLVWQRWSSGSVKWDDEARNAMFGIWKGFKLEGRALVTLDADVRELPAEADEFPIVEKVAESVQSHPTALHDIETAIERELRTILKDYVVVQTGGGKRYFLMPGHPEPSIATAAGLAGVELGTDQLDTVFGPYLPSMVKGKQVFIPNASDVLKQAKWRRQVHRVGFHPGGPESYVEGDGHAYLNAYKAIPVEPVKPTESQIAPLLWLLRRVLDDHSAPTGGVFAQWLVRLYAFVLRNPGVKVKWAPLLYSAEQGTGKTTLMETLPALLFGRQYVKPMVHTVLRERFAGAQFDSTWWCCLTEMHSDAGKVDARTIANKLKPWITDHTIQIEKKGVDSYEIANHLQFTAVSNHDDALFIEEGSTDRRWLVGEMLGEALSPQDMALLNPLFGDDHKRDPRAQSWLHWYFRNSVDISGFNPSEPPPETLAKQAVREHSRSVWEDKVYYAWDNRSPPFDKEIIQPIDLTEGLLIGKGVTISQARSLLRKLGIKQQRRIDSMRYWFTTTNHDQWAKQKPSDIKGYLRGGPRPFSPVDDGSDLM